MKTQHSAYRQFRSVFGIASIPNTDFASMTPNKFNIQSHWVEVVWKHNTQHIANLSSVFGIASNPNIDFLSLTPNKLNIFSPWLESVWKHNAQHIAELGQYLGLHQYLRSKIRSKEASIWDK